MIFRSTAIAGFILMLMNAGIALANPPSAEAFIPEYSQFSISPNGQFVAVLRPLDGRNALQLLNLEDPTDVTSIPAGEHVNIIDYRWYNDEIILVNVGWGTRLRRTPYRRNINDLRVFSIRIRDSSLALEDLGEWGLGSIIDNLEDSDHHILVDSYGYQRVSGSSRAIRINVYTGSTNTIARGRTSFGSFVSDTDGNVQVYLDGDEDTDRIWIRERGSVEWEMIHETARFHGDPLVPLKILEGGQYLYLYAAHEGRIGLYRMDWQSRGALERVFLHDQYDVNGFGWDPDTGLPTYVTYMADTLQYHFFDATAELLHDRINRLLPGAREHIISSDQANNRHIIESSSPGEQPVYYFMDEEAHAIDEIAVMFPRLEAEDTASVEAFSYQARDGLEIPAYLALPPNAGEGPHPLVVWPHRGPHLRENQEFHVIRQFLATRGYAVFVPNFRGSTGYGNAFYSAGLREWGDAMQNDLTDGVLHLIDQGLVDPDRICIVGWSYGAYAAMTGLVQTPELYQCGVAINGVYDLHDMQRELGRTRRWGSQDWWRFTMGRETEELLRVSPAHHADRIQVPVLILYSEEDRVVPNGQHEIMVDAMREAGVDFQERVFEEGNQSMNYGPSMIATLEAIEGFLAEHLQ